MLSAESRAFSTSSLTVVYKHFPGCSNTMIGGHSVIPSMWFLKKNHRSILQKCRALTLSNPAIFLFSAKNSAGLFCSRTSAFLLVISRLVPKSFKSDY